jgi:hypothetical protein
MQEKGGGIILSREIISTSHFVFLFSLFADTCVCRCVCVCVCVCLIRILVTDVIGAGQGPESAKNACGSVIAKTVRCETGIRLWIDRQQHEQSMKSQRNPVS